MNATEQAAPDVSRQARQMRDDAVRLVKDMALRRMYYVAKQYVGKDREIALRVIAATGFARAFIPQETDLLAPCQSADAPCAEQSH